MRASKQPEVTDYADFTHYATTPARRKKLDVGNIFLNQVECRKCGWIIRSKNRHHRAVCDCGETSVDGGSWYQKTSGSPIDRSLGYKYPHKEQTMSSNQAEDVIPPANDEPEISVLPDIFRPIGHRDKLIEARARLDSLQRVSSLHNNHRDITYLSTSGELVSVADVKAELEAEIKRLEGGG